MSKKILVIQFRTDKSLMHERQCIMSGLGLPKADFRFINTLNSKVKIPKIKDLDKFSAIITGGSGQVNISNWTNEIKSKILRVSPFLKEAVKKDKLMLNICFGHQLLAYILGGSVEDDQDQAETGTFEVTFSHNDPLLRGLSKSFWAVEGHKDSVTRLPNSAAVLARSKRCQVQSYKIKRNVYSVQFHPELDKAGMKFRMNLFPSYTDGKNIDEILKDYKPTPHASKLLKNFSLLII